MQTDRQPPAELQINVLGPPQVAWCGRPVTEFISDKVRALFYYLVITGEPHTRAALATLCWGDQPEKEALRNLRRALHNLQQLFAPHLSVSRQTIAFQPETADAVAVDLWQLNAARNGPPEAQTTALAQVKGALLETFTVADAPTFDTWLHESRTTHQLQVVTMAQQLLATAPLTTHQESDLLQHLVAYEPWNEVMQRQLLTLLARQGHHATAVRRYTELQHYLEQELGIPPEPTTTLLIERIQRAQRRSSNPLPQFDSPLIGRHAEVAQITQLLTARQRQDTPVAAAQLLTLTGPGGSGKTRLALAVAHELQHAFLEGVWWVGLSATTSVAEATVAIARAIGLDLQGTTALGDQIAAAVQGWDGLLILDNSEHLRSPEFSALILQLLAAAPTLRLLLTSRERLHLQQEQIIAVPGLQTAAEVEAIFVTQARQVLPTFAPDATEQAAIQAIGQLVDGLPLALTLAAALVAAYPCTTILSMLEQDLALLNESVPPPATASTPPQPRTDLRAVFTHSWQRLTPQEQRIFAALAHLPGDFDEAAATAVITPVALLAKPTQFTEQAATPPPLAIHTQLRGLVHKSLLQVDPNRGRYWLHDLLRRFAAQQLAAQPELAQAVGQAYNRYFINFIQSRRDALLHAAPTAIAAVNTEFVHIRHVWQWACTAQRGEALLGMLREMGFHLDVAGRHQEGEALFVEALALFDNIQQPLAPPQQYLRCGLLLGYSNGLERLGRYAPAAAAATEALQLGETLDEDEPIHFALLLLGRITLAQGKYATAIAWLTQGAAFCAERSLATQQARMLLRLGEAQLASGDIRSAAATFAQALSLATTTQEQRALLYAQIGLGACALAQRDAQRAQQQWQQALALAQHLNVPTLLAETQVRIAGGLLMAGLHDRAAQLLHAAFPHMADQSHGMLFATAVRHLAWLHTIQHHWEASESLLQRATQLVWQNEAAPQQVATLLAWGRYLCAKGEQRTAMPLLFAIRNHPAATWVDRQVAGALLTATDCSDDAICRDDDIIETKSATAANGLTALLAAHFDADAAHAADAILLPLLEPTRSD